MTRSLSVAAGLVAACAACAGATVPDLDPGLGDLALVEVRPWVVLPGTSLDLAGASFVPREAGLGFVHLFGTFTPDGNDSAAREIDVELHAEYVDDEHMRVPPSTNLWSALGGASGRFRGSAWVAVDSAVDHRRHETPPVAIELVLAQSLAPRLDAVTQGAIQVNQRLTVSGDGLLLGSDEGETRAVVSGCFLPAGRQPPCATNGRAVADTEVVVRPAGPWDRARGAFAFSPRIAGIHPGTFTGKVTLRNHQPGLAPTSAPSSLPLQVTLGRPGITRFSPEAVSLGQFVEIRGGGFVGAEAGYVTLVRLQGTFRREDAPEAAPVDLVVLPRFVAGDLLRYVLDETDVLGKLVDLRQVAGTFKGTATPIVRFGEDEELGAATPIELGLAHVKQIVYLRFDSSYVEGLRLFGLRAADHAVRERVLAVARRDYAGVNVEFRTEPPTDFALYAQVDILGPDPNNLGLLGYDNTPGKDVGNTRLYDRIGGVNATTQQDGFPGYGGVFSEQFLGFSTHPPSSVAKLPLSSPAFDRVFDPLRPDTGGRAASAFEATGAPMLTDGYQCPAATRLGQVACAVFVLGNLIGTTLTHETGHSLGLANPYGDGFHDVGDLPSRLMEAGGDRPFEERAELEGQGPAVFCDTEFTYLRSILPTPPDKDPRIPRPPCE